MSDLTHQIEKIVHMVKATLSERRFVPRASYRLEFHPRHLTFRDAAALVPYLSQLGISHVYSSPYFKTSSEAEHGYAIVDYNELNPRLGSRQDYDAFVSALHQHGMRQILDIVPNHMAAIPGENPWWTDVLENGQSSRFNEYFDIDWNPPSPNLKGRLLLPILGEQFGATLEAGAIQVRYSSGRFQLHVDKKTLPFDLATLSPLLHQILDEFCAVHADDSDLGELQQIVKGIEDLPSRQNLDSDQCEVRIRQNMLLTRRLDELVRRSPSLARQIELSLERINGEPGRPWTFDALEELLSQQAYRLSHWRAAADEVNYRRFFDINELVAVCPERLETFEASHRMVCELLVEGKVDGLRIDHVDGLLAPRDYLWRLQWSYLRGLGRKQWQRSLESRDVANREWNLIEQEFLLKCWKDVGGPSPDQILHPLQPVSHGQASSARNFDRNSLPLYVVVEKILSEEEPLPVDWPVAGTSGYAFLNLVGGLFVEPEGFARLRRSYARFTEETADLAEVVSQSKRLVLESLMPSELQLLGSRLKNIAEHFRRFRDFTLRTLVTAVKDLIVAFPVYRTYLEPDSISERDLRIFQQAFQKARRVNSVADGAAFDFLKSVVLDELEEIHSPEEQVRHDLFVQRLQQVTSPVMAKGVEDTAFYRWIPLISVNEVGGTPASASHSVAAFHEEILKRQQRWPQTFLATSTHDTKRSEDVRSRIHLLSEIPEYWRGIVARWSRLNRRFITVMPEGPAPSRNDEHHFYQAIVGFWPASGAAEEHDSLVDRLLHYMLKSARESKLRTSWTAPDLEYEEGLRHFVQRTLRLDPRNRFLQDVQNFVNQFLHYGLQTSLSQILLKLTVPGVPDFYQGQELWDFSLVDPDNRRPVDYVLRRQLIEEVERRCANPKSQLQFARELNGDISDPRTKLFVISRLLKLRKMHPDLFALGEYAPVSVIGETSHHVCALLRRTEQITAIVVAPRWRALLEQNNAAAGRCENWENVYLDGLTVSGHFQDIFTAQTHTILDDKFPVSPLLHEFPIACLVRPHQRHPAMRP